MPSPVAPVDPTGGSHAVVGAADRVGPGRERGVDEGLQKLTQQIRQRLRELLLEQAGWADTRTDVIAVSLS